MADNHTRIALSALIWMFPTIDEDEIEGSLSALKSESLAHIATAALRELLRDSVSESRHAHMRRSWRERRTAPPRAVHPALCGS